MCRFFFVCSLFQAFRQESTRKQLTTKEKNKAPQSTLVFFSTRVGRAPSLERLLEGRIISMQITHKIACYRRSDSRAVEN